MKNIRLRMATYKNGVKRKGDKIKMGHLVGNVHNNEVVRKSLSYVTVYAETNHMSPNR